MGVFWEKWANFTLKPGEKKNKKNMPRRIFFHV